MNQRSLPTHKIAQRSEGVALDVRARGDRQFLVRALRLRGAYGHQKIASAHPIDRQPGCASIR